MERLLRYDFPWGQNKRVLDYQRPSYEGFRWLPTIRVLSDENRPFPKINNECRLNLGVLKWGSLNAQKFQLPTYLLFSWWASLSTKTVRNTYPYNACSSCKHFILTCSYGILIMAYIGFSLNDSKETRRQSHQTGYWGSNRVLFWSDFGSNQGWHWWWSKSNRNRGRATHLALDGNDTTGL